MSPDDRCGADALSDLIGQRFTVSSHSSRMGYRLNGQPLSRGTSSTDAISDVTLPGGIQVPGSGDPILLMADRQTAGGYPQLAAVVAADLPIAAQLAPGDWVAFALCTAREAREALVAQEQSIGN